MSILDILYHGNYDLELEEVMAASHSQSGNLELTLRAKMTSDEKCLLEQLIESEQIQTDARAEFQFRNGFRLGIGLIIEGLFDK